MRIKISACANILALMMFAVSISTSASPIDDLQRSFASPPDDARVMMRWWWFGPAVTKTELEREMRLMKEGGIGGFEVQPVYPLAPDDPARGIKNLPFLSDEFLDALRFTSTKARELGLRFDLTLGSGWPFGGPTVTIDDAAARLRYEHVKVDQNSRFVKVPAIGAGEKLLAVFLARTEGASFAADSVSELTNIKDGIVELADVPAGPHEVLFFISSRTGMQVKRPAVGAEGFVLDHMNRGATDRYLKMVGDRLMQAFPSTPPYAIFCDSLEVYNADWCSDFLEEFLKRRGYDLKPHLPALVNEMGPQTKALRRDWGLTLTELLNERFLSPLYVWSRQHHTLFRIQDYGVPAAALSSNAFADLPEGEGHLWKTLTATRWASSASHIYGHNITSSETWTWLHSPTFRATPLDMKAEADRHFLEGINQLIGHGWPYTAPGIEYPGWRFYAAAVFDEKNPWWIVMPDVTRYLQRVSYMMRQGQPVNDVAIYLPNDDARASFTPGNVNLREVLERRMGRDLIPRVLGSGFNFDFFDDDVLSQTGRIDQAALALGNNRYRIVILPGVETIPLGTYRKLEEFVRNGGILIATRNKPARQPGFTGKQSDDDQVREISARLFDGTSARGHFLEDEATQLSGVLSGSLTPDVALSPAAGEIGFVHRKLSDGEVYFLANTSNTAQNIKATFRVPGMNAESWDPMSGTVTSAKIENRSDKNVTMALALEPYGSRVIVFSKRAESTEQPGSFGASISSIDLSNDWMVTFTPAGKPTAMSQLHSWSDADATRFFSGTATYSKELSLDSGALPPKMRVRLDFGEGRAVSEQPLRAGMQVWFDPPVREAAVVYLNDQRAGSVWCPPYFVDVTSLLHVGRNTLRIVVGNTALNYMAGHSLPDYRLLNLRYGERFQAQDMDKIQPLPSGLLGPLKLISLAGR
jgi:alpha-L-rhamnosidase